MSSSSSAFGSAYGSAYGGATSGLGRGGSARNNFGSSGMSVASSSAYTMRSGVGSFRPPASVRTTTYQSSLLSRGSAGGSELGADWVSNTLSWAEDRKKQPPILEQQVLGSSASSVVTSATSVSRAAAKPPNLEIPAPKSQSAGNLKHTGRRNLRAAHSSSSSSTFSANTMDTSPLSYKDGMSTFRSTASTAATRSPVSAFGANSPPAASERYGSRSVPPMPRVPGVSSSGVSVASASTRGTRSTAATAARRGARSRKRQQDAEYSKQREELDMLMDQVLQLQDQGRFDEVKPFLKRIATLQSRIESGWQDSHEASTGRRPSMTRLGPMPDFDKPSPKSPASAPAPASNTPTATSSAANAGNASAPSVEANGSAVPAKKQRKPGHKPASPSLGDRIGGIISNQLVLEAQDEDEDEDDEDDAWASSGDASSSSSSSAAGATKKSATPLVATPPTAQTSRRKPGASLGLSRHVSDHLLLLSGDEEEEIIETLKTQAVEPPKQGKKSILRKQQQARSPKASTSSTLSTETISSKPVFSSMRSSRMTRMQSQKPQPKERSMLSLQGYMYKSPPESKRFSRWRNRLFVLAGPILSYIKSGHTSRMILLKGAKAELVELRASKLSKKGPYEIRVQCENAKRVYRLRQRSRAKALEWFVAILNNIRVADEQQDATVLERKRRERAAARNRSSGWQHELEPSRVGEDIALVPEQGEDINAHYKALDLEPTSSGAVIKKRYRELAREYHPDKNKAGTDVTRFTVIANAFETLSDKESRKSYDLCERIKSLLRKGIVLTMHEANEVPYQVVMFADAEFRNLYWQDPYDGSVLAEGYNYVELRFVEAVLAGSHLKYQRKVEFLDNLLTRVDPFVCPPGKDDYCLSLVGARLGCTLGLKEPNMTYCINLQCSSKQAREDLVDGLRTLRCRFSERFKQQLEKIDEENLR
ncbi:DnaJ family protein [Hondaea fermentalgiana]|uniref:DnaJ family protein n=1 Tax=Hondaea fermentalgiana TaxID=2315210 RepID=A0A2R5GKX9_9STRA|nr:DnaJ family protein [Hondaea fermentalgiana]|eukprot:GBG28931.1 DnaJ family protein [Hondaea fermentalgiana]